ncbi:proteasome-interacting protein cic1 [Knufia obscura]|uniref:Proteasome-interacting protein cic1 n=2 Tax=Knufia TaxID=430999 RepID=A0AAN8I975_9EURO|nr:proteasome-interacting protein cic1 [Knufia obscura]KAK5958459.1 proteasome-interacting protein cic1 [Knufia fluminis]
MALTTHVSQLDKTQTPYKIDPDQTLRASQALLKHVKAEVQKLQESGQKKNLLAAGDSDDEDEADDAQPIWLNLATKQYLTDKHRLKPSKIPVPHSLNTNENATICLITTDPQRAVKNAVADPAFPSALSTRITRIIGLSKLLARYKSFEQRRQLVSEHDIFLADDRIISRLPKLLGKVFYKGTAKRPIPINLAPKESNKEKSKKIPKEERQAAVASPAVVAKEIEKALACVPVTLSPGYNIAVRVGLDSFTPEQLRENATAAAGAIIEKHVVSGWKNVKSIHIKSPTSVALPVWLAEDLWSEKPKAALVETAGVDGASPDAETEPGNKRKRKVNATRGPQIGERKKARLAEERAKEKEDAAARKARLSAQKASAFQAD